MLLRVYVSGGQMSMNYYERGMLHWLTIQPLACTLQPRTHQPKALAMNLNRQGVLLTTLMLTAFSATAAGAIRRFAPAWQPGYLIGACFLICLEAGFIHHIFRVERMWLAERARYLVPEIAVMVALMRVATTLSVGGATLGADLRSWLYDPLSIFDAPFLGFIIAGLVTGGLMHASMRDLGELAPQPYEGPELHESGSKRHMVVAAQDRAAALQRISGRFVGGGVLLLCSLGLEAVNIARIAGPSRPISGLSAGSALLYLASGFLLYSQARLALLRARWQLDGAQVAPSVARHWARMSWMLVVGVVGAALLLPRAYGLGLLDTLRGGLGLLGYGIVLLGYLVLWIFSLLALIPAWLISLFTSNERSTTTPPPALPPFEPPPETIHQPNLLSGVIFWICMIVLAGYAVLIVAQRHPALLRSLMRRGPLAWLLARVGWLWRDTRAWVGQASQSVQDLLRRPVALPRRRVPSLRLSRLAPRDLVRYLYRSTLRRAAAIGMGRRRSQTPYEYRAELAERLPDLQQDLADLTEAFVVAHYSARPVGPDDARRARRPWERVRRRLRAARNQNPQREELDHAYE